MPVPFLVQGEQTQLSEAPAPLDPGAADELRQLMAAVPVADPRKKKISEDLKFTPIPSPIFPVGHDAPRSTYREVAPGHRVACHFPEVRTDVV